MTGTKTTLDAIAEQMTANDDKFFPIYGTNSWQNLEIDEANFPVLCYDLPEVNYQIPKTGFIGETYPLTIYIAYKSELDWTGAQHEEVIEKANVAMREWISRMQTAKDAKGNRTIEITKILSAKRVRCVFNVCSSGIMMICEVKPTINASVCVTSNG